MGIPVQVVKKNSKPPIFHIDKFKGVNKSVTPTQISNNESPDMLNMQLDEAGALDKRFGFAKAFKSSLGATKINGIHVYGDYLIVAQGTNIYEIPLSELI